MTVFAPFIYLGRKLKMSLAEEISKAIGAHGMWKQRLRNAIDAGKSEFTPDTVAKDNACDFGQWLYGNSLSAVDKGCAEYKAVKDLHAKFHQCASGVLKWAVTGKKADAETMMGTAGSFTTASGELTRAMMTWKAKAAK